MGWLKNLFKSVPSHEEALMVARKKKRELELQCTEYEHKINTYKNKAKEAIKKGDQEGAKGYAAQIVHFENLVCNYRKTIQDIDIIESHASEAARTSNQQGKGLEVLTVYAKEEAERLKASNSNQAHDLQNAAYDLMQSKDINETATKPESIEIYSSEVEKKLEEIVAEVDTEAATSEQIKKEIAHKAAEAQAQGA